MDNTDKKILGLLQESARTTNVQLAQAVNLSPPAVLERVKKLEEKGVIRKYVTLIDEAKTGKGTQAFVAVSLELHDPESIDRFTLAVKECPAILECYHLAGEEDYLLKVLARDIAEYESFLLHTLTRIPGIRKVRTLFVLSTIKKSTKIPLDDFPVSEIPCNQKNGKSAQRKETSRTKNRI